MTAVLGALLLTGCGLLSKENVKLRDLDFTVLSEEKIPEELKTVIAEKGTEPFQLTYSDNQNLYISIGYGEQKTGDRKSTRLNSSHRCTSRMPSSA